MLLKSYENSNLLTYTSQTIARQSIVTVLHTSGKTMLKCKGKQNLIKIDHVVQELCAFSLTNHDRPHLSCWVKPCLCFVYQCQDNVKLYKQAKFDENIPCSSRVRAFSLKELNHPKLCSVKPRYRSAYQRLENVKIHYIYKI